MKKQLDLIEGKLRCNHPPCLCLVLVEGEYCSDWCRSSSEIEECACEHEACAEDVEAEPA